MNIWSRLRRETPQHLTRERDTLSHPHNFASEIISRNTLFWLLLINIAVLTPLYDQITPWSMGICIICLIWRIGILFGKVSRPPRYLISILAIASISTLLLLASSLGVLNSLINMLALGYSMKFIEVRKKRDVKSVILVGYFLIALTFLDNQSILNTLHLLLVTIINTCGLISLYQGKSRILDTLHDSGKLIFLSLPLAGLLFITLPRLPPLWMVPQPKSDKTGLSDVVRPGDIQQLTRSPDLAFRATFEGNIPPNQQLYWRALVLDSYDGEQWKQNPAIKALQNKVPATGYRAKPPATNHLNYLVISEPTGMRWLYALDRAYSSSIGVSILPDHRLYAHTSIEQKFSYQVSSSPQDVMDLQLSTMLRHINLMLPQDLNPETRKFAQKLTENYPEPRQRMLALMQYFNQQPFFYTLSPPQIGKHQIDNFLFNTRSGFCVHYASAMVVIARASGLPARMVTGYLGGEFNPQADYVSVYQYMAHAWAEIWHPDKGWVRYDPTDMVAPERVLDGFDAVFNPDETYLEDNPLSTLQLKNWPWLNRLRLHLASADYYWSIWVLGFNPEKQHKLLKKILGNNSPSRTNLFFVLSIICIFLMIAWYSGLFKKNHPKNKLHARYQKLLNELIAQGIPLFAGDGPRTVKQKTITHKPVWKHEISQIAELMEAIVFNASLAQNEKRKLSKKCLKKIDNFLMAIKLSKFHKQKETTLLKG